MLEEFGFKDRFGLGSVGINGYVLNVLDKQDLLMQFNLWELTKQ